MRIDPGLADTVSTTSRLRARIVTANRLQFGVLEAGSGPLALCLHGFPDSARTWRYLLPALADAGFHAVAPFMRGYAPTDIPEDGCFGLGALVADAVGLHDVLGGDDRAVLVGSDWGAEVAYGAAAFAPDRWRRVVTLGVPPLALDTRIFADYDQLKRFFYLFFLRHPLPSRCSLLGTWRFLTGCGRTGPLATTRAKISGTSSSACAARATSRRRSAITGPMSQGSAASARMARMRLKSRRWLAPGRSRLCTCTGTVTAASVCPSCRTPGVTSRGSKMEVVEGAGDFLQVEKPAR